MDPCIFSDHLATYRPTSQQPEMIYFHTATTILYFMDYQLAFSSFSAALLEPAGNCLTECGAIKGVDLNTSGVILFFLTSSGIIKTNVRKCLSTFSVTKGKREIKSLSLM